MWIPSSMHSTLLNPRILIVHVSLLRVLRKERQVVDALTSLGIAPHEALDVLTHPSLTAAQGSSGVLDGLFDASDRPEGGDVIIWWNNLETDTRQGSVIFALARSSI